MTAPKIKGGRTEKTPGATVNQDAEVVAAAVAARGDNSYVKSGSGKNSVRHN